MEGGGEGMREEYALVSRLVLKLNQGACAAGHRVDNRHLLQTSRNDGSRTLKERKKILRLNFRTFFKQLVKKLARFCHTLFR